ncbi:MULTISPECIES: family 43 glycosylhydrolase [unclassified Novosphingobium]|uniref:family 43 glycosylhydrolase n=1 Tax=unclassified Novosphingobium TaxID=2644732 RepID=UPI00146C3287|nr:MULTISPECIES: family 43 glycosylhydrolase [unclassified Novosphingobium]NMN04920.1 xylan 1,4-beta-xylosidase [Novosphingobium sp. SG919]NMN87213.1 xylan 1,4-beta-xylosidase [Novosphingobium sp. SG916]
MTDPTRRDAFKALAVAGLAPAGLPVAASAWAAAPGAAAACHPAAAAPAWARGQEGQRRADLGNGTYRNPILGGDHPDPTVLKDGDTYYMTFSSFYSYPGLIIWKSTDLVNWAPVGPALHKPLGTVWAVDLCKHAGRYFIYIPAAPDGDRWSIYAIHAERIEGPWSDPVDLNIPGCIDPGHVVGEDGERYLFVNGIRKIRLAPDGLSTAGPLEPAYAPWVYPQDWIVEGFSPEGPKLLRRNGWFYITTAVGGTAGPPTGHMVIVARSRSVHGPWEHCPHNPIVRTVDAAEPWWSRGHATMVEGPGGDWWMIYHGYENGYRTLGRQTLLEPIVWTAEGWPKAMGGDLSRPLPKPRGGRAGPSGMALSDDFAHDRFGLQWAFHEPSLHEMDRVARPGAGLVLAGSGKTPADSSPLTMVVPDRAFAVEVTIDRHDGGEGGLLLFYNHQAFVGLGFTADVAKLWQYAQEMAWARAPLPAGPLRVRLTSQDQIVTFWLSHDGGHTWALHGLRMDVSGMHHNTFGGFLSLKVGLYSAGTGQVRFSDFAYRAL